MVNCGSCDLGLPHECTKKPVTFLDYAPLMKDDDFEIDDLTESKFPVKNIPVTFYGDEKSGRVNFGSENSGQKIRSENNWHREFRSFFWDSLGSIVWLLAVVWMVYAGGPIAVDMHDAIGLTGFLVGWYIWRVGFKYYILRRNK